MPATRHVAYLFACLISLLALTALWYAIGRPVQLADAATPTHKLQCASYTPFGKDQSPFDQPLQIRPEQMDADLALLSQRFECLRTYSVTGLEQLPQLARKYGLKLMVGAWVSRSAADTQIEVNNAIKIANAYPDVIQAVIVGNEALLRKEVTAQQLVSLIDQVKTQIQQPVTYADVWEFWLKHPEIAPAVDFITIHLLPYWEDNPAGIEQALAQVAKVRERFGRDFAPKDILIGETGWPSEGRQRETAVPSLVNQATFIRGFVAMAEQHGWRYNLIEAFDQPWKRISEGAVGGYWGLYDADRQDKSILAGPVSNLPHWPLWLGASAVLFAATLLLGGRPRSTKHAWLLPLLAGLGAGSIMLFSELTWVTSRYLGEWLWAAALLLLNLLILAHAALLLTQPSGWRQRASAWLSGKSALWLLLSAFAGAVMMLALVVDARYRSFPSAALLLPAVVYLCHPVSGYRRELTLLGVLIGVGLLPQLYEETLSNLQAIGWALTCALLVVAVLRSLRLSKRSA
ncbi:beta (1-6) glucans synthase [Pseudomonas sp. 5P_3.1_Bac2]|uniref:glycoside hydrolase family 17 protein n=1 Tax=Pseudomonas sp. 5P_3.1_Bac2 TaxID=2971617 RepID=UPI0021C59CBF|nr:beta (1-6) glucans synthase [Pseudomonas sp. 5P_3.1_Bac2]MCU1715989.1 beta (1-6) glucans synthase [Pseudomonas sp. 5P_3.1_Bac2]